METNNLPPEPQIWPYRGGFNQVPRPNPPAHANNAFANRPIVWNPPPAFPAPRIHHVIVTPGRIFKIIGAVVAFILLILLLNNVSKPKMSSGTVIAPANQTDRLIQAIDKFLDKR